MASPYSMKGGIWKVDGLSELDRKLSRLDDKLRRKIIREVLKEAAVPIHAAMEAKAPRSQGEASHPKYGGHLADQIIIGKVNTSKEGGQIKVGTTREAFWGVFLELGTKKMAARPFARPAFDQNARVTLDKMAELLSAWIESQTPLN